MGNSIKQTKESGKIGLLGATAIGIGGMVGGGIFAVLGEAVSLAHGATALAFLIAGGVALLTAYSYTQLSLRFPSQGGTVVFIDRAFGVDLATGTVNLVLWLSYLVTISLYAVAFGSYAQTFFGAHPPHWLGHVLISAAIVLPIFVNLFNAAIVAESETVIVALKLLLLVIVIAASLPYMDTSRLSYSAGGSTLTVVAAGMVIFVAYEGFELIANSAEEVLDLPYTLPRAYYGSVVSVIILYCLIAMVTVGTVPEDRIVAVKDYALAVAAKPALGTAGFTVVALSALLATFSAINATIYGNARLGYILAKERELPELVARKAWNRPVSGVLVVGVLALAIANSIDLTAIATLASAGFLLIFSITNAAAVRLAEGHRKRWIPLAGTIACLGSLLVLLGRTYQATPSTAWIFVACLVGALLFELGYSRWFNRHWRGARMDWAGRSKT